LAARICPNTLRQLKHSLDPLAAMREGRREGRGKGRRERRGGGRKGRREGKEEWGEQLPHMSSDARNTPGHMHPGVKAILQAAIMH